MQHLLDTIKAPETLEKECEKHGTYQAAVLKLNGRGHAAGCPECRAERIAAEADRDARMKAFEADRAKRVAASRMAAALQRAAIPPRFARLTFNGLDAARDPRAVAAMRGYLAALRSGDHDGGSLILSGPVGVGKTHLACAVLNEAVRAGLSGLYLTAAEAIDQVQSGYKNGDADARLRLIAEADLLVMDEMGRQKDSPDAANILFKIIDKRYQNLRPTIAVTNYNGKKLKDDLGDAVFDRLIDGGRVVTLGGPSRRAIRGETHG